MPKRLKTIVDEYNKHAAGIIPTTLFTVMLWLAAQNLINEAVKDYAPMMQVWQVAAIEIFVASFGLWFVTKSKEENDMSKEEENNLSMIISIGANPAFGMITKKELAAKFDVTVQSVFLPSGDGCIRDISDTAVVSCGCAVEVTGAESKVIALYRSARGELG